VRPRDVVCLALSVSFCLCIFCLKLVFSVSDKYLRDMPEMRTDVHVGFRLPEMRTDVHVGFRVASVIV
jgi:hypothetical protein